jgi:hypothetical protein
MRFGIDANTKHVPLKDVKSKKVLDFIYDSAKSRGSNAKRDSIEHWDRSLSWNSSFDCKKSRVYDSEELIEAIEKLDASRDVKFNLFYLYIPGFDYISLDHIAEYLKNARNYARYRYNESSKFSDAYVASLFGDRYFENGLYRYVRSRSKKNFDTDSLFRDMSFKILFSSDNPNLTLGEVSQKIIDNGGVNYLTQNYEKLNENLDKKVTSKQKISLIWFLDSGNLPSTGTKAYKKALSEYSQREWMKIVNSLKETLTFGVKNLKNLEFFLSKVGQESEVTRTWDDCKTVFAKIIAHAMLKDDNPYTFMTKASDRKNVSLTGYGATANDYYRLYSYILENIDSASSSEIYQTLRIITRIKTVSADIVTFSLELFHKALREKGFGITTVMKVILDKKKKVNFDKILNGDYDSLIGLPEEIIGSLV